jgi:cytoskeleton protein RodZ
VQAQLPTGKRYGTRNRTSRITLRAHRPTHIAVQGARNRTFIDRVLWPGDTYRVPNSVGLRLSSPDAGAVELILDGTSVGFAGKDGATAKNLSLNPQNVVDRQQRG